jgi:hypothetical protein
VCCRTAVADGRARRSLRSLSHPPLNGSIVGQTGCWIVSGRFVAAPETSERVRPRRNDNPLSGAHQRYRPSLVRSAAARARVCPAHPQAESPSLPRALHRTPGMEEDGRRVLRASRSRLTLAKSGASRHEDVWEDWTSLEA